MVLHLMRIKVNGDESSPYAVFCRCLGVSAATEVFALFAKEPKYENTFSIFSHITLVPLPKNLKHKKIKIHVQNYKILPDNNTYSAAQLFVALPRLLLCSSAQFFVVLLLGRRRR